MIYLASYPRSGNTYMRTVLWQCFGVASGSVYPRDMGDDAKLHALVGHVELWGGDYAGMPQVVKTHRLCDLDASNVLYVVRDPRAVACSIARFYRVEPEWGVEAVCKGTDMTRRVIACGSWVEHVSRYRADAENNRRMCRYEDVVADMAMAIDAWVQVSQSDTWKPRASHVKAAADGRWHSPRESKTWRDVLTREQVARIETACGPLMDRLNYQRTETDAS